MKRCWCAALWLGILLHCRAAVFRKAGAAREQRHPLSSKLTLSSGLESSSAKQQLIQMYPPETPPRRRSQEHLTPNPVQQRSRPGGLATTTISSNNGGVVRFSRVRHYVLEKLQNTGARWDEQIRRELNEDLPAIQPDNETPGYDEEDEGEDEAPRTLEATWHGNSFVPFRYRCQVAKNCRPGPAHAVVYPPPGVTVTAPTGCHLLRWNYELPFSEMPNLVFSFLATDMISGHTTQEKSRFLNALLNTGLQAFMQTNSSSLIFSIPEEVDTVFCKIKRSVEPALKSLYQMLNIYTSRDQAPLLTLVRAAKSCLDNVIDPFPLELLPCLDFSFGSEELLNLTQPRSIFGNPELCRRYLRYNISKCLPARPHFCNEKQLTILSTFAKRFYMCAGSVPGHKGDSTGQDGSSLPEESYDYDEDTAHSGRVSGGTRWHNSHSPIAFLLLTVSVLFLVRNL